MSERVRAKDSQLGKIHKNYVDYLADRLAGRETDVELTPADHTGIRNLLKDNGIVVEPDVDKEADKRKDITLTLVGQEVTTQDILGASGCG
jgi:hypothetical protein